jgi:hypothetical protein
MQNIPHLFFQILTEIDNTVQHSDDRELAEKGSTCTTEVDSQDIMMATPLNPVSSLETLALVASNASSLPVINSYHAQCQTPVWVRIALILNVMLLKILIPIATSFVEEYYDPVHTAF